MSSTSKPLFQEIDLKPGDLTSGDKVVWLMYLTEFYGPFQATFHGLGLEDIIGQREAESMKSDQFSFHAGDMPDIDPGESKERLVLAIFFFPQFIKCKGGIEQTILAHAKRQRSSFPNNHRAAFVFPTEGTWYERDEIPFMQSWSKTVLNVAGHFTSVLMRERLWEWRPEKRTRFNELFGDLIRAGTDSVDIEYINALDIIKYVLNHDRFRVEEEMIGWNPVVSTKAGKIYKETLATLTPGPFENCSFNSDE
ncbi:hypothetical protein FA15DRAFT_715386 [Coprinopsis marcescibilis]|uniref:Uncharacterized protein n=1 Tax=Coprinopsis marcescibilis TaxID=230819 RepID=A0A5C3L6L6_COPMA|nr:hypothetical protein FA15DRAFT_715386 [Coprinopsis marcescibilis]